MEKGFFLITGTSRGIGAALAGELLAMGHTVLGLSRNQTETLNTPQYFHLSLDLADTSSMRSIMKKARAITDHQHFDFVCLVNNASAVEPIATIENCQAEDIQAHINTGLIAPLILTSLFMRAYSISKLRKKVAFISSGAAFTPLPGESVYCSTKAWINMFAQCVGLEQGEESRGFEVISIGPGMVDTSMQRALRSKPVDEFALASFFKQSHEDGKLQEPGQVAKKIVAILFNRYAQGKYVSVSEV